MPNKCKIILLCRQISQSHFLVKVRLLVTYKVALLTYQVRTTATPTYLSELVQTYAPPRALHSSDAPMLVVPRIHTELARRAFSVAAPSTLNTHYRIVSTWNSLVFTGWHSTVRKHSHIQMPLENPSVQTHLVLLCCHKRPCILGPKGTIQMCYYLNCNTQFLLSICIT